jgi:hypothetical protein
VKCSLHICGASHLRRRKLAIDHGLQHECQPKADRGGQGGDEDGELERGYDDRYPLRPECHEVGPEQAPSGDASQTLARAGSRHRLGASWHFTRSFAGSLRHAQALPATRKTSTLPHDRHIRECPITPGGKAARTEGVMRYLNGSLCILLALFTIVQYNDPDAVL